MHDTAVAHNRQPEDTAGYCRRCRTIHALPPGNAQRNAYGLIKRMEQNGSIALTPEDLALPSLSTEHLFGEPRGKMFGVLECLDTSGRHHFLYAFSGLYSGTWQVPGWAPPLFDVERFEQINNPQEARIKALTRHIEEEPDARLAAQLKTERTGCCRRLMKKLHELYVLTNVRGESASLEEVVGSDRNKPTGIGDCCAPKLLNHAATNRLKPVSMAEFYFGRRNRSCSRHHKQFYPPCKDKCGPLLGFLLCGL